MKNEISNKKLLFYSLFLYLLLFISELFINFFSYITNYSKGKLTSSFFAKIKESLNLLKYDIALYFFILITIYVIFALINYKYITLVSKSLSKRKFLRHASGKSLLFLLVNVFFISSLYLFNYASYPSSIITEFGDTILSPENYQIHKIIAYTLFFIYFSGFLYLTLKYSTKKAKILAWGFLGIILIYNLNPLYHFKNIFASIYPNTVNTGPNIIFIGIDSLNPEHTKYFDYQYDTTPNLDRFLKKNIVFKNCYTPLARTCPSWHSILTGQYPKTSGVRYNLMNRKFINQKTMTISNFLHDQKGYFTAYFTDETRFCNIHKKDGFQYKRHPIIGVKDFIMGSFHDFSLTNVFFNNPLGYKLFTFLDINRAVYPLYKPQYFTQELKSFLTTLQAKKKFFLTVHFCAPHWPYSTPAPYPYLFYDESNNPFREYDGALRIADTQLGKFLKALKKKGLYKNSIIVILSDHGETLYGHGTNLRDSAQNRIIVALKPNNVNKHREIQELTRTIDITPTVLDLLGEDLNIFNFDGMSLKTLINNDSSDRKSLNNSIILETGFSIDVPGGVGLALQEMLNEGFFFYKFNKQGIITVKPDLHKKIINRKQRAIQNLEWKLIVEPLVRKDVKGKATSLFFLTDDPECKNDVSEIFPQIYDELLMKIQDHYKGEIIK